MNTNLDETPVCAVCKCPIDEQENGYCEDHQPQDDDERQECAYASIDAAYCTTHNTTH